MYKLIRRISSSVFPRPDRPWSEDATSTAPRIGTKRRMSDEQDDRDGDADRPSVAKKQRSESVEERTREPSPADPGKEAEAVKAVTDGVREVELSDADAEGSSPPPETEEAAAVPLPESPVLAPQATGEKVEAECTNEEEAPEKTATKPEEKTEDAKEPATETTDAADEVPGLSLAPVDEPKPAATKKPATRASKAKAKAAKPQSKASAAAEVRA